MDPRLGINGLFVADEPFGPMMFALLPIRAHAMVDYTTKDGKFIEGKVVSSMIHDEGWLYEIEVEDDMVVEGEPGRFYLAAPVKVSKTKRVLKEDVLKLGWEVEITGTQSNLDKI